MSKVVFLGAGASVDADYPLTTALLGAMEERLEHSLMANEKRDWETFSAFRQNASGRLATVLQSPNPELILTVPDLLEATLNEADQDTWRQLKDVADSSDEDSAAINAWWDDPDRKALYQGYQAKLAFQRLADGFFSYNHARDSQDGQDGKRAYLHNALDSLEPGDTVITANWDTLAERTLMEAGKWFPTDGYGFAVPIEIPASRRPPQPPAPLPGKSDVKVLKLHGSTGWFRRFDAGGSGDLYLRDANFLQYLTPPGIHRIRDRNAPPDGSGPDLNPVIIVPSYLKQLDDATLQSIWIQAATALNNADEVTFVGYSLPAADAAIRVLINPLRQRLTQGAVSVSVVDPNKATLTRWTDCLGEHVNAVEHTARMFYAGQ